VSLFRNLFRRSAPQPYQTLQDQINYHFRRPDYLKQAFRHRSVDARPRQNYERLEFLGDAVVDIIVSRELMQEFPEGDEGLLTQKRSALVQKSFLGTMGKMLNLLDYLEIEPTVNLKNEKVANKQYANLFEALVGALFLDGGLEPARRLILETVWQNRFNAWKSVNYKGQLIEYCHAHQIGNPKFQITDVSGPDHQKLFEVHVRIGSETFPTGIGYDKKSAEQAAAQQALDALEKKAT